MNNFKKGGFRHGGGGASAGRRPGFGDRKFGNKFGGGRGRDNRSGGRMELFPAVCFECKKNCEVPFRPTGDKPVYCLDCFNKQPQVPGRNSDMGNRPRGDFQRDVRPPQREYQHQPEPVRAQNNEGMDVIKRQLGSVELKVNRILELMSQKAESPTFKAPVTGKISKSEKVTKVKSSTRKTKAKEKK